MSMVYLLEMDSNLLRNSPSEENIVGQSCDLFPPGIRLCLKYSPKVMRCNSKVIFHLDSNYKLHFTSVTVGCSKRTQLPLHYLKFCPFQSQ